MKVDERLLQADEDARRDALDISRSYIVQAPAGSGKTELLIQRYLRLLSIVDEPEEIAAITFTRKAAAEMQYRVLRALQVAARGEVPGPAHLKLTAELAAQALHRDSQRNWNILENPRRLRIQTLDSLNGYIARSQPMTAPGAAGGRIAVDADLSSLHRAAALATFDWLGEQGAFADATREVLEHLDNNTDFYVDYVSQMLKTRDQWLPFTGTGELGPETARQLRRRFEDNLEDAVRTHLEGLRNAFPATIIDELVALLAHAGRNMAESAGPEDPVAALAGLETLPGTLPEDIRSWRGVAEALLRKDGEFRKTVDKRSGFPPGDGGEKEAFKALLESLAGQDELADSLHQVRELPPTRYSDEQWQILLALFRLLPLAAMELRRLFASLGVTDHIEIAMTADAALGDLDAPGDVALLLDYQVRHILVDEMQDTSSAQYRMLDKLTAGWTPGDGRTLYCVGDPMQSIYRFRNAEVGQFLLAREHGIDATPLESLVLRRNFRSGKGLVDWFNHVFPGVLATRDDPATGAVSYSDAVAVPELTGDGRCVVHPLFGSNDAEEAAIGCKVIAETLERHADDDMAVLVRSRTHLPGLLAALRDAGIPYRAIEIDRLTDLPEVIELLALTRAAVHQGDRVAWLGLLRAPWIGLDWTDLHAIVADAGARTVIDLLSDAKRLESLSERGRDAIAKAMPALSRLVAPRRSTSLRNLVESCWIQLGGPAIVGAASAVDNVYRFLEVLGKHERHGSLDDPAELENLLDQERVSTAGGARLQVMTMHKAKGLEFEHVLLYGLGRRPRHDESRVLSWFDIPDAHGAPRKIISPIGRRVDVDKDPVHRFIERAHQRKGRYEQARLLYVACTRARKTLHLLGHVNLKGNGECGTPDRSSLLHMLWPVVAADFDAAFGDFTAPADAEARNTLAAPRLEQFESPWTLPEAPALPGSPPPADTGPDAKVDFYWVGTEARIAGTVVHRWLHALAEGRLGNETAADDNAQRSLTHRWLKEMGVAGDQAADIQARVGAALGRLLDDERGRWLLGGGGHAELALSGVIDGEVAAVVLDRVRIDDDGTHWIVDYKTSSHEGGNVAGFLAAETERYGPQLRKYAALYDAWSGKEARCALYFPLLQTFLEVPR